MSRSRAARTHGRSVGFVLFVIGLVVCVGVPVLWLRTHRDPALVAVDPGAAVALATADPAAGGASSSTVAPEPPTTVDATRGLTAAAPPRSAVSSASTPPGRPSNPSSARPGAVVGTAAPASPRAGSIRSGAPTSRASVEHPLPSPAPIPQFVPVSLRIPALGIDAAVVPVGVDDRGEMAIPANVRQVGWYRYSAAPGAPAGSTVLAGHVDSRVQGLGAFADLGELAGGDLVLVADPAGRALTYRVVSRQAYPKTTVPLAALFSHSGAPRLTLVTCGGDFDANARSYLDNIVVTALPT